MGVNWIAEDGAKRPYSTGQYVATHPYGYIKGTAKLLGDQGHDQCSRTFDRLYRKFTKNCKRNWHDTSRLWSLILNCEQVLHEGVEGDLAEVGVYRGNSAAILAEFAKFMGRRMYLFDTFSGFDSRDPSEADGRAAGEKAGRFSDTSIDMIKETLEDSSGVCSFVKGYFPETFTVEHKSKSYSIISIDCDLYKPAAASFDNFYPLLSKGGTFFIHDYGEKYYEGITRATDEFCNKTGERLILMPDMSGTAIIRKTGN